MSTARVKSKLALQWSIDELAKAGSLRMWTFTLPCLVSIPDARKSWSLLLNDLKKELSFEGVRVFELHENHGLHVHCVVNKFYPIQRMRAIARQWGWGRIHVARCNKAPYYVAKYVSKGQRVECFKGVRLWAAFGGVAKSLTKCRDVEGVSGKGEAYRSVEKQAWLKKYRARGGALRGRAYIHYRRECNNAFDRWLCDGRVSRSHARNRQAGCGAGLQLTLSY